MPFRIIPVLIIVDPKGKQPRKNEVEFIYCQLIPGFMVAKVRVTESKCWSCC
jgi:hypothetical protein